MENQTLWPNARHAAENIRLASFQMVGKPSLKKLHILDDGKFVPVVVFDCRGLQVDAFKPEDGFEVDGANSSQKWKDIDLSDDWVEYDAEAQTSVGIYSVETEIQRGK